MGKDPNIKEFLMFQVIALKAQDFAHLFDLPEAELKLRHIVSDIADSKPGFPCRVSLQNAEIGERVLLLNYEHQPADSPFRASHAIYVRQGAMTAQPHAGEVPEALAVSPMLSVRAFSADGMIQAGELTPGVDAAVVFDALLARDGVAYLHAHYAKYGCFAARIVRT